MSILFLKKFFRVSHKRQLYQYISLAG